MQANAILARAIPPLARTTKKEIQQGTDLLLLEAEVRGLTSDLKNERDRHAETQNKVTQAQRQAVELKEQYSLLQQEFVGLEGHAKKLIEEKEHLAVEVKDREKAVDSIAEKYAENLTKMRYLIKENAAL